MKNTIEAKKIEAMKLQIRFNEIAMENGRADLIPSREEAIKRIASIK